MAEKREVKVRKNHYLYIFFGKYHVPVIIALALPLKGNLCCIDLRKQTTSGLYGRKREEEP